MTMDNLTPQQKSVMLAKAMGWEVWNQHGVMTFRPPEGLDPELFRENTIGIVDLYHPANMALAWRVLNWAMSPHHSPWVFALAVGDFELEGFLYEAELWKIPPADAQRLFLDKILELAIEAGIVDPQPPAT